MTTCFRTWISDFFMQVSPTLYYSNFSQCSDGTMGNRWSAVNYFHINGVQVEGLSWMHLLNLKLMTTYTVTWNSTFFNDITPTLSNKTYPLDKAFLVYAMH